MSEVELNGRADSGDRASFDFAAVDEALAAAVDAGQAPGLVAAVTDRRGVVYRRALGLAATATGEPMRIDTVFRVASMTKLVTTVAILMLHEHGEFELDDPFAMHLPGFEQPGVLASFDAATGAYAVRDAARPVTIRDLLTHTSGYGYWFLAPELLRVSKGIIKHFEAPFLMHDPGERFTYGIGTDVLGELVEPLSGMPLGRFVAERIAEPLGMRATGWQPPSDPRRLAALHKRSGHEHGGHERSGHEHGGHEHGGHERSGHERSGHERSGHEHGGHERSGSTFAHGERETRGDDPHGGGGLYTTADDYLALLRLLLNNGAVAGGGRLLDQASVAEIGTNQIGPLWAERQTAAFHERSLDFAFLDGTQKFGFNVMVETRNRPTGRPAGSYGWGGVFNTFYWVDPEAGFAALLLMQLSPFCDPGCMHAYRAFERAIYRR
jgi:methyl acetate hydrolase